LLQTIGEIIGDPGCTHACSDIIRLCNSLHQGLDCLHPLESFDPTLCSEAGCVEDLRAVLVAIEDMIIALDDLEDATVPDAVGIVEALIPTDLLSHDCGANAYPPRRSDTTTVTGLGTYGCGTPGQAVEVKVILQIKTPGGGAYNIGHMADADTDSGASAEAFGLCRVGARRYRTRSFGSGGGDADFDFSEWVRIECRASELVPSLAV
jgi:hypothetical protein